MIRTNATRGVLLLLLCLAAMPLSAEHEATMHGEAYDAQNTTDRRLIAIADAAVTVEFDPMWGQADQEALEDLEGEHGPLPDVTVAGQASTDDRGHFRFTVTFSVDGDGQLPVHDETPWCSAFVYVAKDGYGRFKRSVRLEPGKRVYVEDIYLWPPATLTFRVAHESDGEPAANLKLRITPQRSRRDRSTRVPPRPAFECMTDADGVVELGEDDCPVADVIVTLEDTTFAWPESSRARRRMTIEEGENDWGRLLVTAGGVLSFRCVDVDTGEPVKVEARLFNESRHRSFADKRGNDGVVDFGTLPADTYRLEVRRDGGWGRLFPSVEIKPGEVCELGRIELEPYRKLMVFAEDENGTGIEYYSARIIHSAGDLPLNVESSANDPYRHGASLTAEACELERLFTGTWTLVVSSHGLAPTVVQFEVPRRDVTVRLFRGGHIRAEQPGLSSGQTVSRVLAFKHGSEAEKEVPHASDLMARAARTNPARGLFVGSTQVGDVLLWKDLPIGRYTLVGKGSEYGIVRLEGVEVRSGETTTVNLTFCPSPAC